MRKLCELEFSDGVECLKIAVATLGGRWYCAEHYDGWIRYYRHRLINGDGVKHKHDGPEFEEARRILRESTKD